MKDKAGCCRIKDKAGCCRMTAIAAIAAAAVEQEET
jgi:hypothetical protein